MAEPMLSLFQFLLIFCLLDHNKSVTLAHQLSSSQASNPITTVTNASTASTLTLTHSRSHASLSASGDHAMDEHNMKYWGSVLSNKTFSALLQQRQIYPRSIVDISTELPAPFNSNPNNPSYLSNYQDILSGVCTIGDDFCFFKASNGSMIKADSTEFSDECVLWDDACSGNKTAALKKFFDIAFTNHNNYSTPPLYDNNCFLQESVNQSDCNTFNPPERLSEFRTIKDWMRSSQCVSAADEWIAMTGYS